MLPDPIGTLATPFPTAASTMGPGLELSSWVMECTCPSWTSLESPPIPLFTLPAYKNPETVLSIASSNGAGYTPSQTNSSSNAARTRLPTSGWFQ